MYPTSVSPLLIDRLTVQTHVPGAVPVPANCTSWFCTTTGDVLVPAIATLKQLVPELDVPTIVTLTPTL
jgi:hypothetical protein